MSTKVLGHTYDFGIIFNPNHFLNDAMTVTTKFLLSIKCDKSGVWVFIYIKILQTSFNIHAFWLEDLFIPDGIIKQLGKDLFAQCLGE